MALHCGIFQNPQPFLNHLSLTTRQNAITALLDGPSGDLSRLESRRSEAEVELQNPSGTSSGRRDFVRPEFIAMLNDAGGPRWSYESRAGL